MKTIALLTLSAALLGISSAHAETFSASYEVPVPSGDESLKPFAKFQIQLTNTLDPSGRATLLYPLPPELVGPGQTLAFTQTAKPGEFASDQGTLRCACGLEVSCQVTFKNLNVDPEAAQNYLQSLHLPPAELNSRFLVAHIFGSGEAGGILTYVAPGSDWGPGTCIAGH